MFSRTPIDVIKSLRKGKIDRTTLLTSVYSEIKQEIKSTDLAVKTNAVKKLFVLTFEGYEMGWASFNILQVMSSPSFTQKRTGLLTAQHSMPQAPQVQFLTINLFRRDLVSYNFLETCLSLNCLAALMNSELAQELMQDCLNQLNTNQYIIRKKACVVYYKLFVYFPQGALEHIERLTQRLKDDNPGVVMATVNTLFQISRLQPSFVLFIASELYKLMISTKSNWLLIKLLKCFVELSKIEPRLLKKLLNPITSMLQANPAKSVQFELIRTIAAIYHEYPDVIGLALGRLQSFLDSNDANCKFQAVKYLGLQGLQLILANTTIKPEYRAYVLDALASKDLAIKLRALDLLKLITDGSTVVQVITQLIFDLNSPQKADIKQNIVACILYILSNDHYINISDFKWLFEILGKIVLARTNKHQSQLSAVILDVVVRVEELRSQACELAILILQQFEDLVTERCEAMAALIFIVGEYSSLLSEEHLQQAIQLFGLPRWKILNLPQTICNAIVSCLFKLSILAQKSVLRTQGDFIESKQRYAFYQSVFQQIQDFQPVVRMFGFLNPVHPSAQALIQVPQILNQPTQVNQQEYLTRNQDGTITYLYFRDEDFHSSQFISQETRKELRRKLKQKQAADPFYISSRKKHKKRRKKVKKSSQYDAREQEKLELPASRPTSQKSYTVNRDPPIVPQDKWSLKKKYLQDQVQKVLKLNEI